MIVKIVKCPKCLQPTLIIIATNSNITKECSNPDCNFAESKLLSDYKKN